jgi:hypothetical protein
VENITDTQFHGGRQAHQRHYQSLIVKAVADGRVTEQDMRQITAFLSEIQALNDISSQRILKLAYLLVAVRRWFPEFSKITTTVLFTGVEDIKSKSGLTLHTQGDVIKLLKCFLLWLHEAGETDPSLNISKLSKIKAKTITTMKTVSDI